MSDQNFDLTLGDTRTLTFTIRDRYTGLVVDLTGATLSWKMAKSSTSTADVSKTTSSGITVSAPTTGVAVVTISPSDTSSLAVGDYYHELQVTDSSSRVSTVAKGRARLTAGLN